MPQPRSIERISGFPDGRTVKEKLNELIDAHNSFSLALTARVPHLNEAMRQGPFEQPQFQLTSDEIKSLTVLLMQWGWICRCVCPRVNKRGHLVLCSNCHKPVPESNDENN